jgi:hypothetical protein
MAANRLEKGFMVGNNMRLWAQTKQKVNAKSGERTREAEKKKMSRKKHQSTKEHQQ